MLTGEALAVAFEPQSLIVMGDASGFSDEPYGAVRAGHPIIRCQWPLPLITRMSSCGVIFSGNGEDHTTVGRRRGQIVAGYPVHPWGSAGDHAGNCPYLMRDSDTLSGTSLSMSRGVEDHAAVRAEH